MIKIEDIGFIGDILDDEEKGEAEESIKEVKPFEEYAYAGKWLYAEIPDIRKGATNHEIIYKGLVYDDNDVYDAAYNYLMDLLNEKIVKNSSNIFELYMVRGVGYDDLLTYSVTPYRVSAALIDYLRNSESKEDLILRLENLKETSNISEHILNDYISIAKTSEDGVEDIVDKILDIIDDDVSNVY